MSLGNGPQSPPPGWDRAHAGDRAAIQKLLAELETERERVQRQRRRNLVIFGACLSLLVHICIMWYLSGIHRAGPRGPGTEPVAIEFNILQEEELTELPKSDLAESTPDTLAELSEVPEVSPALNDDLQPPAAELDVGTSGSMESITGGAGSGGEIGIGTGSARADFFGVSSTGERFVYIVDTSGSMSGDLKMRTAMSELARSISSLPDYVYYHIVLFSSSKTVNPDQPGWVRARKGDVLATIRWLRDQSPVGGTQPLPAFAHAFDLDHRPDVIFFMTDGQIPKSTPSDVRALYQRGSRVVINTIAFGDPRSQDLLKEIAADAGGTYRFVPSGSN